MQTLKQKSHIVVGTPGRVMDLVRRGSLQLSGITHLVIDEADLMLDMGFLEEVGEIISLLPENRKILLFSATLEKQVQTPVSYTHLDVYKRQAQRFPSSIPAREQAIPKAVMKMPTMRTV